MERDQPRPCEENGWQRSPRSERRQKKNPRGKSTHRRCAEPAALLFDSSIWIRPQQSTVRSSHQSQRSLQRQDGYIAHQSQAFVGADNFKKVVPNLRFTES